MKSLQKKENYMIKPKEVWKKIRFSKKPKNEINIIKKLAEYRELQAQNQNLPRNWLLTDREILQIARIRPTTQEAIHEQGLISEKNIRKNDLERIIKIVNLTKKAIKERKGAKKLSQRITANESIKNMLILLLKLKCRKHGIAEKMIATNNQIQNIASGNYKKVPALLGWRKEIFGNDAIRLKKGEISLKISRGKIVLAE